jgi:hypothetical protein
MQQTSINTPTLVINKQNQRGLRRSAGQHVRIDWRQASSFCICICVCVSTHICRVNLNNRKYTHTEKNCMGMRRWWRERERRQIWAARADTHRNTHTREAHDFPGLSRTLFRKNGRINNVRGPQQTKNARAPDYISRKKENLSMLWFILPFFSLVIFTSG